MSTKQLLETDAYASGYLLWWLGRFANRRDGKGLNRYDQNGRIGSKAKALRSFVWERTKDLYRKMMESASIESVEHILDGEQYDLAVQAAVRDWVDKHGPNGWQYKMSSYWRQYDDYKNSLYINALTR